MLLRSGGIHRGGRVPLCRELPLLQLPPDDRFSVQPFAGIERGELAITKGATELMIFGRKDANDTHCGICGSLLFSVVRGGAFVHVPMGTLIDNPTIRPTHHIFVGSKAPWFIIADDLPQYEGHVPLPKGG